MKHITGLGYVVQDTLSGADVYDDAGNLVCQLPQSLSHFEDGDGNIDDDALEKAIDDECDVENFLDYQSDYC